MTHSELQKHIYRTYVSLRVGLVLFAPTFPFLLWVIARWNNINLPNSISEFYWTFGPPNFVWPGRVVFVGVLFFLGLSLILYRGFTTIENWMLNLAGALAIVVALCPMPMPNSSESNPYSFLHLPAAYALFVCLAFVALFCTKETLVYYPDPSGRRRFQIGYGFIATIMIISPGVLKLIPYEITDTKWLFIVETIELAMFSAYWGLKSLELYWSEAEWKAITGEELRPFTHDHELGVAAPVASPR